jgi:hypothetical protein
MLSVSLAVSSSFASLDVVDVTVLTIMLITYPIS